MFVTFKKSSPKVLYVSSPLFLKGKDSSTSDYFSYIISELAQQINKIDQSIDFVIKVPSPDEDIHRQQVGFIDQAVKNISEYKCIVVSPYDRNRLQKDFYKWKKHITDEKVYFIDQGYPIDEVGDLDGKIPRPPYAQANWKQGGECAGISMADYFKSIADSKGKNRINPNIIIVQGTVGSEERIDGFKSGLIKNNNENFFINPNIPPINVKGLYSKEETMVKFEETLNGYLQQNKIINGIFCCNDEMALGVKEVLENRKDDILEKFKDRKDEILGLLPIIVGFDGIKDVKTLISKGHPFLYDTVLVNIDEQIRSILNIIKTIAIQENGLHKEDKFVNVECNSYRKVKGL